MLGLPYRVEPASAERRRTPEFLALNPLGQIPVLRDKGEVIADSNAILVYLALTYDSERRWYPADPLQAAQVQRWLSIAAGELRHGPGAARLIAQWGLPGDPVVAAGIAQKLLEFMEGHLQASDVVSRRACHHRRHRQLFIHRTRSRRRHLPGQASLQFSPGWSESGRYRIFCRCHHSRIRLACDNADHAVQPGRAHGPDTIGLWRAHRRSYPH